MKTLQILLLVVLGLLTVGSASAGERKVVAQRADCEITKGDRDDRGTDLIVATCDWEADLSGVQAVIRDAPSHVFFSSVVVSRALADGRIVQIHRASGISDREVTLDFTETAVGEGGVRVGWTKSAKQEPIGDGRVEVVINEGYWEVHGAGEGKVKVIYSLRYDPGGRVPSWVVRAFQKNGIADIVEEMRDVVSP
jgi:hypothetical protein